MLVTVLSVPGCPNVAVLEERLARALGGRADVLVSRQVIATAEEAARTGMHGSPTILVDGVDPFAGPDFPVSISCRLYADSGGKLNGAPSERELRAVLGGPARGAADAAEAAEAADAAEAVSPAWLDTRGRAGRGRVAPAERGLRAVHQAILRSFAATGSAPEPASLADAAAPFDASGVIAELADGDYLCRDRSGRITAAYPFSATTTAHRVHIAGGAAAYAMCAVDALGMALMLGADVLIESRDPRTGEPVTVSVPVAGAADWRPATAVVFAGRVADSFAGPSANVCCSYINFFTSHESAAAWAAAHPEIIGGILGQARALDLGQQIFGRLLR